MEKKLKVDFASSMAEFDRAIKEFQIRKMIYRSVFRGKGLEFDSYRYFQHDEDAQMIDWKASLRANRLLAKQYIEERNLNIYFLVDCSNSMLFGSEKKLKAEYVAEIVIALSNLMMNSNDNVGLILFSNREVKVLFPGKSKNQLSLMIKYLSEIELYGKSFDLENAVNYLLKVVQSFSVVILVSDFIHLKKGFEKHLRILSTKFETFALMVRDRFDEELPRTGEQIVLQDPHSGRQIVADTAYAAEIYRKNALEQRDAVMNAFKSLNIDLLELKADKSFVMPLVSFLKMRAGRVR